LISSTLGRRLAAIAAVAGPEAGLHLLGEWLNGAAELGDDLTCARSSRVVV
jgi:hypothetical protein